MLSLNLVIFLLVNPAVSGALCAPSIEQQLPPLLRTTTSAIKQQRAAAAGLDSESFLSLEFLSLRSWLETWQIIYITSTCRCLHAAFRPTSVTKSVTEILTFEIFENSLLNHASQYIILTMTETLNLGKSNVAQRTSN